MKPRGLLIAVVVLAALAGVVYWSNKTKKAEESKPAADTTPKILSLPEDQIQQVEIKRKDGEDTVLRRGNLKWQLTSPTALAADQDAVSALTSTLSSLSSDSVVEKKVSDPSQFGLASPSMEVIVTKKDGKTQKLLIGDETPTGSAFFAAVEGDPRLFTLASYNKSSLDKNGNDLRDKRLLTFDSEGLTRVDVNAKKQTFEFGKNNQNEWQILKPKPMRADGGQVEELIRKLKDAKMDTTVSADDAKKAAKDFASGTSVAAIEVTDGSGTQRFDVKKKDSTYYAKSSVVEGIYKITSDIGDGLDKGLDDYRNKKLFDFGFNDPSKVEVRDGAKTVSFEKSGEKWMSAGRQMDSSDVQGLIDKLRDLSATKFAEKGFANPFLDLTVTWNGGKRAEKVSVAKQGDTYLAMRAGEPAIYQLDKSAVEDFQKAAASAKTYQPPKK